MSNILQIVLEVLRVQQLFEVHVSNIYDIPIKMPNSPRSKEITRRTKHTINKLQMYGINSHTYTHRHDL